jgi:integrase
VLRAHRSALAELDLRMARDDALVLPANDGGVRHPERFSRAFSARVVRARKAIGEDAVPVIRLHDLRHTHATGLLQIGTPVHVVQQRLGHATPAITLGIYGHVLPTMGRTAAVSYAAQVYGGGS